MKQQTIDHICGNESSRKVADIRKMRRLYRAVRAMVLHNATNNRTPEDAANTAKCIKLLDRFIRFDDRIHRVARKFRAKLAAG